jgi:hypothetical protein
MSDEEEGVRAEGNEDCVWKYIEELRAEVTEERV